MLFVYIILISHVITTIELFECFDLIPVLLPVKLESQCKRVRVYEISSSGHSANIDRFSLPYSYELFTSKVRGTFMTFLFAKAAW